MTERRWTRFLPPAAAARQLLVVSESPGADPATMADVQQTVTREIANGRFWVLGLLLNNDPMDCLEVFAGSRGDCEKKTGIIPASEIPVVYLEAS